MISYDGFEDCVIERLCTRAGQEVLVYDYDKCVQVLIARDGMEYEEAVEYMAFNVVSMYVGEGTPIFMYGEEVDLYVDEVDLDGEV